MTWEKKRVLITVKAYPEKSFKYGTVVCSAGITDEGKWIRLYPITMNYFCGDDPIKKYYWIEVECERPKEKLMRKESYRVRDGSIKIIDRSLSAGGADWEGRNDFILPHIATSMEQLKEQFDADKTSLGLIKPADLLDFYPDGELEIVESTGQIQSSLFGPKMPVIDEISTKFKYRFRCDGCSKKSEHNIMCEDWELIESYRSWGKRYENVDLLWEKLYQKYYFDMVKKKDLHFYVGTFSQFPTWLIIGIYYPPRRGGENEKEVSNRKDMTLNHFINI